MIKPTVEDFKGNAPKYYAAVVQYNKYLEQQNGVLRNTITTDQEFRRMDLIKNTQYKTALEDILNHFGEEPGDAYQMKRIALKALEE